ncbi:MAG: hypothetical protein PHF29_07425 [Candidatus Riflebacteria bacterium]|nr:hypothetical protein [Candidatus Riflebacteria bacterium]
MPDFIVSMSLIEQIMLTSALSGTLVFALRALMMFMGFGNDNTEDSSDNLLEGDVADAGIDTDLDVDGDAAGDVDVDGDTDVSADTNANAHELVSISQNCDYCLKPLSVQGLSAFFMMFGWVGLSLITDFGLSPFIGILGGILAGYFTVCLLIKLYKFFISMQSDGTMRVQQAFGSTGTVYLRIPKDGKGQVSVVIDGRLCTRDAISEDGAEIKTGEKIEVVWVNSDGLLKVKPVEEK